MHYITRSLNLFILIVCIPLSVSAQGLIDIPDNPYKAPLFWSVYEYHIVKELGGEVTNHIPEEVFLKNINYVEQHLMPYGYEMVAIDGWGDEFDSSSYNDHGYRTKHSRFWEHDYSWWAQELQSRGMNLGIYQNPLWVNLDAVDDGLLVKGTSIPLSAIIDTTETTKWFTWVQVDSAGAEEYVKGYVQHFADMGVKYLRVDFLSWYEDGTDKNYGSVGPDRTREDYITALSWIKEACDANDMLLSLVMPSLNNEAEVEQRYGHMIRINEDVLTGGWERFSELERGVRRAFWSQYANTFDGYIYWSGIAGRDKMILDGDFIRLNTMANDHEKKTVISLHLMAGGPVTPSDQFDTIGDDLKFYQNVEMLDLNKDGFVGKPLTNDPTDVNSQIWKGQMSDGDWVVALFNREDTPQSRSIDFNTELGLSSPTAVRDLWEHSDLGTMTSYSETIPAHGVTVLRIGDLTDNDSSYVNTGIIEVGADSASNYQTWEDGSDEGTGFSNWIFGGSAAGRSGIGSSQNNGGGSSIDTDGKSFYLSAADGSNDYIDIFRFLIQDLQPGQTFSFQMDVNWRGGFKGIRVRGSDDNTAIFRFEIGNPGGGDDHVVYDAETGNGSIGNNYSDDTQFTIELTQTSSSGGTWTIRRSGGITDTDSGTYSGTVSSFQLYSWLGGSDAQQAIYFNNFKISNTTNTIDLTGTEGWRLLSVPVAGQTFENLLEPIWTQGIATGADTPEGASNVYVWDINATGTESAHWAPIPSLRAPIIPGSGFLVYVFSDDNYDGVDDGFPKSLTLSGTESSIDVSPTLNAGDSAWTLLGNPFSTPIDFDEATKGQLTDIAYIWDPNTNNWKSWNGTAGDITDGLISPYQGFFVQNDSIEGDHSITFNSSKSSGGSFYGKAVSEQTERFKIHISNEFVENSLWVQLSEYGSEVQTVKGDAVSLAPLQAPYILVNGEKSGKQLDIIHLPNHAEYEYTVPVHLQASESGEYMLSFESVALSSSLEVYLEDLKTGELMEISDGTSYIIQAESSASKIKQGVENLTPELQESEIIEKSRFRLIVRPDLTVSSERDDKAKRFELSQNYPNPFNPSTRINYTIAQPGNVTIEVYSVDGRTVAELVNSKHTAGSYSVDWNASNLSSGVYIYRISSNGASITRKMTLIK